MSETISVMISQEDIEKRTAELAEKLSAPVIEAFKAGLLTREEALAELRARGSPYGVWQNREG